MMVTLVSRVIYGFMVYQSKTSLMASQLVNNQESILTGTLTPGHKTNNTEGNSTTLCAPNGMHTYMQYT